MPQRLLSNKATAWHNTLSAEKPCLIFSMLLGLVSGFDIVDIGARLDSQEEMGKVGSTLGLLPPASVDVCTTPVMAKLVQQVSFRIFPKQL